MRAGTVAWNLREWVGGFHVRCILFVAFLIGAAWLSGAPAHAALLGSTEQVRTGTETTGRWSAMLARVGHVADPCAPPLIPVSLAEARPDEAPAAAPAAAAAAPACRSGEATDELRAVAKQATALPILERVRLINAAANRRPYVTDKINYGAEDYWATLDEFAARGGDCEDYAIAKYMLLKAAGVAPEAMRIAVVYDLTLNASHAVLGVDVGGTTYILDNQVDEVLPDGEVGYYQPVYSVNERGWWLHMPA